MPLSASLDLPACRPEPASEAPAWAGPNPVGRLAEALALHLGWTAPEARVLRAATEPRPTDPAAATLAAEFARHQHERWDGNGRPLGLRDTQIPPACRLLAVVTCFHTLTRPRPFRPARAEDCALAMLAEQAGQAFDPALVAAFLHHAPGLLDRWGHDVD
ncbi:HD-GYP domain-containing protein [Roseateles sp. BYS87W]|uniref:HD-GYP domain-containing protein n=1 Tax=Pelomonas baiyunensis TaxID=3299026 RepID=A0ABW7H059_9BURK